MASGDSKSGVAPNTLVGMGNPLLDLQATVGKDFLDKWGLKENDAILSDEKHIGIFDDLAANYHVEYVPGGATQNAMRVCQWILNEPGRVAFFGAIGNDKFGDTLREKATSAGVNVRYQVNNVKTGTCAALINGAHRSLVADLAAANTFTVEHLDIPENAAIIENAKFYYIAGFFLTVCPPAIQRVAKGAAAANKPFMMNLAAPFIPSFFFEPLSDALPYVDILFGNEEEALAFSKRAGYETTDMHEIARKIAAIEKDLRVNGVLQVNKQRQRIVILTQGGNPIIVVEGDKTREFPVDKLPLEKIVDTNGAGDAFCGGFLAQYIRGRSFEESMECGNYAASAIIQQNGCTFPPSCKYH